MEPRKRREEGSEEQPRGGKTLEDYLALPEGTPIEMIDGVFYDRTSSTSIHARISMKISQAFENFITQNYGKCIPFVAPVDVQLDCDDKTMVVPDLFVVCDRNKRLYPWVVGAPDLIVEVVSTSNRNMDVVLKKHKYEKSGVREYWIVFPEEKRIEVHFFEKKERKEYTFADKVPVGIWEGKCEIDFAEIYEGIRFLYEEMENDVTD